MSMRSKENYPRDAQITRAFGVGLRSILWKQDIMQKELAQRSGISAVTISNIVNGRRGPSVAVAYLLAEALDCTIDDVLQYGGGELLKCRK